MTDVSNLSILSANVEADAFGSLMDSGFIDICDGKQPPNADTRMTTQKVGVSLRFSNPAFAAARDGTIRANSIMADTVGVSLSEATWARIYRQDHKTVVMDVSVGTKDAVIVLPSVNLPKGVVVTCSSFSHTVARKI